ncbi:MAG: molecular chaperone DnaJ [Candidatus Komeilibacteria bacterium]|nr:molecular chaperone DnaJ [Candidatus Komeilibacteria bacterium]
MTKDYYKILGIDKNATEDQVKKAFRTKAHEHHPDKSGGNEAKFKEVNEAYQVLGNKEKRSQYDQFGTTFDQAGMGGSGGGQGFGGFGGFQQGGYRTQDMNFDFGDLGDIFGDVFGFGGGSRGTTRSKGKRGHDVEVDLQIEFVEAVFGVIKTIELKKLDQCNRCHGNGAEPGSAIETCKTCNGSGQVTQTQQTFLGAIRQTVVCSECSGEGKKISKPCQECGGRGVSKKLSSVKITIPAGIEDGQSLKLSSQGEAGLKGGGNGDLYIRVRVKAHPTFHRQGNEIRIKYALAYSLAALGGKVRVPTLDGEVELKIPSGTASGQQFVLKNLGVPYLQRSGRGNQVVEVFIAPPKSLNRQQKKLLEELEKEGL